MPLGCILFTTESDLNRDVNTSALKGTSDNSLRGLYVRLGRGRQSEWTSQMLCVHLPEPLAGITACFSVGLKENYNKIFHWKKGDAIFIKKNIKNMKEPNLKQCYEIEQARTCWRSWQKTSHSYCYVHFTGHHWLRATDPGSNAAGCAAVLLCTGWLRTVRLRSFKGVILTPDLSPRESFDSQLTATTVSCGLTWELAVHTRRLESQWRMCRVEDGEGGERHFTADFIKHSWWKLAELHGEATGKWDTISWLLKYGLYKAKGCRSGRTAVLMLRNRAQNCKKLLSIEFHTQLLSRDSQILFSAIPLAKGQISHDLHNFLNRINEIIFPSRQPFFFPPLC